MCYTDLKVQVQRFKLILLPLCAKWDIHPARLTLTCGWKPWLDLRTICIITPTFYAMLMTYCAYTMTPYQLWMKSTAIFPWNPVLLATLTFILAQNWQTQLPNGVLAWGLSPSKYIVQAVKNCQLHFTEKLTGKFLIPARADNSFPVDYDSSTDLSGIWTLTVSHSISTLSVLWDGWWNLDVLTLQLKFQCYLLTWHAHARATLRMPCMPWDIYNWSITHDSSLTLHTLTLTRLPSHSLNRRNCMATWKKQFLSTCLLPLEKTLTFVWW
jgi:hypothetical protein